MIRKLLLIRKSNNMTGICLCISQTYRHKAAVPLYRGIGGSKAGG